MSMMLLCSFMQAISVTTVRHFQENSWLYFWMFSLELFGDTIEHYKNINQTLTAIFEENSPRLTEVVSSRSCHRLVKMHQLSVFYFSNLLNTSDSINTTSVIVFANTQFIDANALFSGMSKIIGNLLYDYQARSTLLLRVQNDLRHAVDS